MINNVIAMPTAINAIFEMVVMKPNSLEEMPKAIQALWERKAVVLNLMMMEPEQAQRAVDFVAGGTYSIKGHQERIDERIFLFTPNSVQVVKQSGVIHNFPPTRMRADHPIAPTPA